MAEKKVSDIIYDKSDTLLLRSLLITKTPEEIIDGLNDEKVYQGFLEIVNSTLEYDKEFFLLQDYLDKTQRIIQLGREKFATKGDLRKNENEKIVALNMVNATIDKQDLVNQYLGGEYVMREYIPYTDELLYLSMANDYYVMSEIQKAMYDSKTIMHIDPKQFLATTSYFSYIIPELYENYPVCIDMTRNYLKQIKKKNHNLKIYRKKVEKRMDLFN